MTKGEFIQRCVLPGLIAAVALACGEIAVNDMDGVLRDAGELLVDAGIALGGDAGQRDAGPSDAGDRPVDAGSKRFDAGNLLIDAAGSLMDAAGQIGSDASAQSSCGQCSTGGTLRVQQAQWDPDQQVVGPLAATPIVEFVRRDDTSNPGATDEVIFGYRFAGPLIVTYLQGHRVAAVVKSTDTSCGLTFLTNANLGNAGLAAVADSLDRHIIKSNGVDRAVSAVEPIVVGEGEVLCVAAARIFADSEDVTDAQVAFNAVSLPFPRWRGFHPYP